MFPDIQKKAQDELDSALERSRLVAFEDRTSLPSLRLSTRKFCVGIRWPRQTSSRHRKEANVVGEYFITKGTVILGNTR